MTDRDQCLLKNILIMSATHLGEPPQHVQCVRKHSGTNQRAALKAHEYPTGGHQQDHHRVRVSRIISSVIINSLLCLLEDPQDARTRQERFISRTINVISTGEDRVAIMARGRVYLRSGFAASTGLV